MQQDADFLKWWQIQREKFKEWGKVLKEDDTHKNIWYIDFGQIKCISHTNQMYLLFFLLTFILSLAFCCYFCHWLFYYGSYFLILREKLL